MKLEPLISHTGILMTFYLSIILDLQNFFHCPLIYPPELEIKETTDTASSASFLELYLEFDNSGQLSTKTYDKRYDFNLAQFVPIGMPMTC
jgi:hypothetical protein